MPSYKIIQAEPETYKEAIRKFWEDYLPGTPGGRFDWLNSGNPAGPALWFLAFEDKSGDLAGTISVMPRDFSYRGKKLRAGIMGDFMVRSTDRVFGPGLVLPKAVVSQMAELGFDLLYTVPNLKSKKIIEKSGLKVSITLKHLVKPVATAQYLSKYVPDALSDFIALIPDTLISILSALAVPFGKNDIEEENIADESFDVLWSKMRENDEGLLGERGSAYLNWKYFRNPQFDFRLITCRDTHGELLGYVFYTVDSGKLDVYEITSLNGRCARNMLRELGIQARSEGYPGIGIRITDNDPVMPWLRRMLFFDARDDIQVLSVTRDNDIDYSTWHFIGGDRNI